MYFAAKGLALVVIERPKGITHFYLSIGLSKKGLPDILTDNTKH